MAEKFKGTELEYGQRMVALVKTEQRQTSGSSAMYKQVADLLILYGPLTSGQIWMKVPDWDKKQLSIALKRAEREGLIHKTGKSLYSVKC